MKKGNVDINNPQLYKQTRKKKYTIAVSMPELGTHVTNFLEGANYITDKNKPFVLTGTVGEQWVIDGNKLAKTYTFENGDIIDAKTCKSRMKECYNEAGNKITYMQRQRITTKPNSIINWAIFVPKEIICQIPTSWGDILTVNNPNIPHGLGDYIVCSDAGNAPNLEDRWVVNGLIFQNTYDMRAFPNMSIYANRILDELKANKGVYTGLDIERSIEFKNMLRYLNNN